MFIDILYIYTYCLLQHHQFIFFDSSLANYFDLLYPSSVSLAQYHKLKILSCVTSTLVTRSTEPPPSSTNVPMACIVTGVWGVGGGGPRSEVTGRGNQDSSRTVHTPVVESFLLCPRLWYVVPGIVRVCRKAPQTFLHAVRFRGSGLRYRSRTITVALREGEQGVELLSPADCLDPDSPDVDDDVLKLRSCLQ